MIKYSAGLQKKSKHAYFAKRLAAALVEINVDPSPVSVVKAFSEHSKVISLKPHTVRKWLLGLTFPRAEMLLLLAEWLNLEPQDLFTEKQVPKELKNKVSFEFDFTDQEVISKYLGLTVKQKVTVRLLIDAISSAER